MVDATQRSVYRTRRDLTGVEYPDARSSLFYFIALLTVTMVDKCRRILSTLVDTILAKSALFH